AEDQELIASWPLTITMEIEDLGRVMFCHATPQSDTPIFTRRTPEDKLLPLFENLEVSTVICGHTHMQFDRRIGDVRVVNAGSVGMPFGDAGACWALLESDVELRRTKYNLNVAAERIRATSYPQAEQFASQNVITRPTEATILDVYSKVELR
ncbi:MAG TPA: metallophosphoesterase family protein, partial [Gemmatimonadaceae bacterium]|nr:metallophosphoesterase family protein [Gemmatimonadaceae bacterium]